jgi:phosphatidylinositol glycan class S
VQVEQALLDIHSAWQHIAAGDYHAAGAAAAAARAAAEAAFLHPSVLAQLNFPDSHKLGVYMPLFLPVSVPLLQGFVLQLKHYVQRRRDYAAGLRAGG